MTESSRIDRPEWEKWFCWYEVGIDGQRHWLKWVERRWNPDGGGTYHIHSEDLYGTPEGTWEYRCLEK